MNESNEIRKELLLHACCGPCSLEPSRLLADQGLSFDIFYANSNIVPDGEYKRRFDTLNEWASSENIVVLEGEYDHSKWLKLCMDPFERGDISRKERCRRCYALRFSETARYAKENGYAAISTTLSVSPYQYTDTIREELERACKAEGIECIFADFRPYYDEATRRSRDMGMYRQNYCGCELSALEAEQEREERRQARKREKERRRQENAEDIARQAEEIKMRKMERKKYDEERLRRRSILKQMRMSKKEGN